MDGKAIILSLSNMLLDPEIKGDLPLPVYKSPHQILEENLHYLLAFLLIIACTALAWRYFRKNELKVDAEKELIPSDPFKDAIDAIYQLKKQKNPVPKPFVFKLSEILRVYVENMFKLPAMELTGQEFMREISSHSFFQNRFKETLGDFIKYGDYVKYSKDDCTPQSLGKLLDLALCFVEETHLELERTNQSSIKLVKENQ